MSVIKSPTKSAGLPPVRRKTATAAPLSRRASTQIASQVTVCQVTGTGQPMVAEERRLATVATLLGEIWDGEDTCPEEEFLGIPKSFADRMRSAMHKDLNGIGDNMSESDALDACAEVLLQKATERARTCLRPMVAPPLDLAKDRMG